MAEAESEIAKTLARSATTPHFSQIIHFCADHDYPYKVSFAPELSF
jgi:hypothetical protein